MSASSGKAAIIRDGKIICPCCGSDQVVYREDVSNSHKIVGIKDDTLILDSDCETEDLAFNERICCEDCGESSELPVESTEFEGP